MIPKIIHYCWFGMNPKPPLVVKCIESWRKYLPEYEIIEWNESNSEFDIDFARNAYQSRQWAFLSDYIRLKALYQQGGLYLDSDMLLLKNFDDLLNAEFFLGYQESGELSAGVIGSVPGMEYLRLVLSHYKKTKFDQFRLMSFAIPQMLMDVYEDFDEKHRIKIYPVDYFYPYSFEESLQKKNYKNSITENSFAVHLWNASWFSEKEYAGFAMANGNYAKALFLLSKYFLKNPQHLLRLPSLVLRQGLRILKKI